MNRANVLLMSLGILVIQACSPGESESNKSSAGHIDGSQSVRINGQPVARLLEDSDGRAALRLAGCDVQQQGERSGNVMINGVAALTLDAAASACDQLSQRDVSANVMIGD